MHFAARYGILLSCAALATGVAACGSNTSGSASQSGSAGSSNAKQGVTAGTINYGLIYDQSGPQTVSQTPWAHGFITQIKKANDAGGVNGRKINLISVDEKGLVPNGVAGYKKLYSQTPVVGISGFGSSSVQTAVLPLITKDAMPLVGPQSITKTALVPFHKSVFAIVPPYADQVDVIMNYETKQLNKPKPNVAVFRIVASSGLEVDDLVKERVQKLGGKLVADEQSPVTDTSADAQVQKIVAAKPDFIIVHSSPTQAAMVLKALQKVGAKIPVISTFAGGGPTAYQAVPPAYGNLMQYTAAVTPSDINEPGQAQLTSDAQKYGYDKDATDSAYTYGYITGMAVVQGLKNAGKNVTRASYIKGLEGINGLDTGGLSEPVTYGPNDHIGLSATRPYKYDYTTKKFVAVGNFTDYNSMITHEYGG